MVIDEEEIIKEILQTSNSDSSNEGSDIEIEKIPHFTALEQCKLLFIQEQDLPRFQSLLRHSIEYIRGETTKNS